MIKSDVIQARSIIDIRLRDAKETYIDALKSGALVEAERIRLQRAIDALDDVIEPIKEITDEITLNKSIFDAHFNQSNK